jgi:hypothetical protein
MGPLRYRKRDGMPLAVSSWSFDRRQKIVTCFADVVSAVSALDYQTAPLRLLQQKSA